MKTARITVELLLRFLPRGLKKPLRALVPTRAYEALARFANGTSSRKTHAGTGPAHTKAQRSPPANGRPQARTIPRKEAATTQAVARKTPAQHLEEKLWGGFAELAVCDLEQLRLDPATAPAEAIAATRTLARYHAVNNDYEQSLECLVAVRRMDPEYKRNARILEIHCLLQLGRLEEARQLIDQTLQDGIPHDGCMNAALASAYLLLARQNAISAEEATRQYLECMSRPLRAGGHVGLALRNPERGLSLDNLAAEAVPPVPESMPAKVSVLMAVYNGASKAELAIRSVLEQSWRNLELVIVDDASTDNSWELIKRLASEDERIVPVRHETNGGAYVARNTALARASGDYVVVNDADDWAHPQKIEAQVSHLLQYPNVISNMTFRVRVAPDMTALPRLDSPKLPIIHNDYSALMLSRQRALDLGGWDAVRFSADAEFVERLCAIEGSHAMQKIRGGMPLSFSLWDSNNLTTASATSILTNRFGSRHEYVRQFREWHRSGENLKTARTSQLLPFPAPAICYFGPSTPQEFDVILVSDFGFAGGTTQSNLQYLKEFRRLKLRVAILPWQRYAPDYEHNVNPAITTLCRELGITTLVHGEQAHCTLLLVHHPSIMMHRPDRVPAIRADRIAVLADQAMRRLHKGANDIYEPVKVQQTLAETFGQRGRWIPTSPRVRRLLTEARHNVDLGPLSEDNWTPIIDLDEFAREPRWRGTERKRAVVGRHGRDRWFKWPATAADVASAYVADGQVDVRLLGGAANAIKLLGRQPANWQLVEFDAVPVADFLADLDFFVHCIHPDAVEAFGLNIAEAMAAGIPVICSPSFRESFGEAAVYADPQDIAPTINSLWRNPQVYYQQARKGQEFVQRHCNRGQLAERLWKLLGAPSGKTLQNA